MIKIKKIQFKITKIYKIQKIIKQIYLVLNNNKIIVHRQILINLKRIKQIKIQNKT